MWDVELLPSYSQKFEKCQTQRQTIATIVAQKDVQLLWIFKIFNAATHMGRQSSIIGARPKLTLTSIDFFVLR